MPSSDTLEFNPYLPEVHEDPYPLYHRLRATDPALPSGDRLYAEQPRQFTKRLAAYWNAAHPGETS